MPDTFPARLEFRAPPPVLRAAATAYKGLKEMKSGLESGSSYLELADPATWPSDTSMRWALTQLL